jgi:hypothetical protein
LYAHHNGIVLLNSTEMEQITMKIIWMYKWDLY